MFRLLALHATQGGWHHRQTAFINGFAAGQTFTVVTFFNALQRLTNLLGFGLRLVADFQQDIVVFPFGGLLGEVSRYRGIGVQGVLFCPL